MLGVIALAVVVLGVWRGEALWEWATIRQHWSDWPDRGWGGNIAILHKRSRWTGQPILYSDDVIAWYRSTGFKAYERSKEGTTFWKLDGTLKHQAVWLELGAAVRTHPAWWWGMTDQTAPSAPAWILDDKQWQAALDAQK